MSTTNRDVAKVLRSLGANAQRVIGLLQLDEGWKLAIDTAKRIVDAAATILEQGTNPEELIAKLHGSPPLRPAIGRVRAEEDAKIAEKPERSPR